MPEDRVCDLCRSLKAYSESLSEEAGYYWQRHEPRFRYVGHMLTRIEEGSRIRKILDVGMGFQTLMLARLFPEAQIEILGIGRDERFVPETGCDFHSLDLNDLALEDDPCATLAGGFDLVVFMEVLEHLIIPPERVLRYLKGKLSPDGLIIVTTPNAAWLKNRIKVLVGRNPFEKLRSNIRAMGHIREYTKTELEDAFSAAGLECVSFKRRGLYEFSGAKDRAYSRVADIIHPSFSRSCVALCRRG